MPLFEEFKEELALIKSAKLTFLTGFIVLAGLIALGEYQLFEALLSSKNEIINTRDQTIGDLRRQLEADQKKGAARGNESSTAEHPATTGPATANGEGVVANSGNSSTVNNGTATSEGKGKKLSR